MEALGSGDLEKYRKLLKEAKLGDSDNFENGFIPEGTGVAAVDLERRTVCSLPYLAYMSGLAQERPMLVCVSR